MNVKLVTCFVCGHRTLEERCDWEICPVCGWEDDALVLDGQDISSPANEGMKVSEAQANYMLFGASAEKRKHHVRSPKKAEPRDPSWTPLAEALALVEQRKQDTN